LGDRVIQNAISGRHAARELTEVIEQAMATDGFRLIWFRSTPREVSD